jgi:TP901 family phage tail tape measure protein
MPGGAAKTLTLELTGRNAGLSRVLADSEAKVKAFSRSVDNSNKHMSLSKAAVAGVVGGVTALAAGLTYAITKAVAFDKAMRNVNSLSGLNTAGFAAMEKQVISMSTKLPQSATTLAEGLYDIASSGFQGADGVKVLDAAARSASAGLTTTAVSARAITGVLNAYGLKAKDAADVSDVLFSTVNLGVISFDELANNLGDVVGSAAAASVSIDQVGSAIATMTLSGIKGSAATTSLSSLITKLVQPSAALTKLYKQLGYESGESALKQDGLRGVMEKIRIATGGNITAMLQLFPDIEAARGALALMANDGANYAKVADQITDKTKRMGATQKVLDEQMKGVSAQWQLFQNRIDAAAISIGVKLLPGVLIAMQKMQDWGAAIATFAVQLKDKLQGGVDDLKDSLGNVLPFLDKLGGAILNAGKAIGGDAIDGAVKTFGILASTLQDVTQFASENETAVLALGLAYAVHASGGVAALYGGLGKAADGMRILSGAGTAAYDFIAGLFTPGVKGAGDSVTLLGDKAKAAGGKLKSFAMMAAPAVAIGGVLAVAITAWQNYTEGAKEAAEVTKDAEKAMSAFDISGMISSIQKANGFIAETNQKILDFGNKDHKIDMSTLFDVGDNYKLLGARNNLDDVQKAAYDAQVTMSNLSHNSLEVFKILGQPKPDAAKWMNDVEGANGVVAQNIAIGEMQKLLDTLGPKLKAAGVDMGAAWDTQQLTNAYSALWGVKQGSDQAAAAQKNVVEAMKGSAGALGDAATAADKLKSALDGLMGASLGVDQAQIDWLNGLATLKGKLAENGATISLNTQKGRDNRSAIIGQVQSLQDLLVATANTGASQETLAGKLQAGRKSLIDVGVAAGVPKAAMEKLLTQYKLTPDLVKTLIEQSGAESTKKKMDEVTAAAKNVGKQNPKPTVTAQDHATGVIRGVEGGLNAIDGRNARATVTVTNTTINKVITERQARNVSGPSGGHVTTEANGGVIRSYANGKLPDQAIIQQAVPGGLFQWAEPETGDEAFIPMGLNKRDRSEKILEQVADEFGLMVVQKFANGGFRYPAFKYPPFRYDPKAGARSQQSRKYLADKAAKYREYEDARYSAYEEFKDRQKLAATASGRYGEGVFQAGGTAGDTFTNLASAKEARAQAAAELRAKTSRSPSDSAEDYYKKPIISLKEYMAALKLTETHQRQWNTTLRNLSTSVGSDVVKALQGMGEQGEDAIRKMATGSVADMKKMAAQIRAMNFTNFFADTASDVKGHAEFQANLAALVKLGRADLASRFQEMGYDQAAGLAAQAVKSPGSTLTQLNNLLAQQAAYNDPKMTDAMKLAALIQGSGGKLGVVGLSNSSGMGLGDVLGLLQGFEGTVFSKIPASAMKQIRADQALLKAGKQPSGLAMGGIIPGSSTGYYWAEKTSGGESLIPHGMDRRRRALQLWRETGRILGAGGNGGGTTITVAPGAVSVAIPINNPGATAGEIEAVARRAVGQGMTQLAMVLQKGRRS